MSQATGEAKSFLYIGEDEAYWSNLQKEFTDKHSGNSFTPISRNVDVEAQQIIPFIVSDLPSLLILDFSTDEDSILHLARALSRMHLSKEIIIIALVDYQQPQALRHKILLSGVSCVHVKSGELDSVVFDMNLLSSNGADANHNFAIAKMDDDASCFLPLKISKISKEELTVESNFDFKDMPDIPIHTSWSQKKLIKSPASKHQHTTTENIFYNFRFQQSFKIMYVDPLDTSPFETKEELAKAKIDLQEDFQNSKKAIRSWLDNNADAARPKPIKTLVLDNTMSVFKSSQRTDAFHFVVRTEPYLKQPDYVIRKHMADLIFINLDQIEVPKDSEYDYHFNDTRTLQLLVSKVKKIQDYDPFIVVFNGDGYSTEKLQSSLDYQKVISFKPKLTSDLVFKMASKFVEKITKKSESDGLVLSKNSPYSYGEAEFAITIKGLSENDIFFDSQIELPPGLTLKINHPFDIYMYTVEKPDNARIDSKYYAIIYGLGEELKMDLRKFINTVFFRQKELEKEKEREDIQKRREKFIADKKKREEAELALKNIKNDKATPKEQLVEKEDV